MTGNHDRVNVLGVPVSAVSMSQAVATFDNWIQTRSPNFVCVRDVHGVVRCQSDSELRRIHREAGLVTPDGMPLVWLCRRGGHPHTTRVYGPDLMLAVCEHSVARGYRHFLYGAAPGTPERLAASLRQRFPGIQVVGTYSPPFRQLTEEEESQVIRTIRDAQPDILWVGLSTPKQERWMARFVHLLDVPVLVGVGAAFDFLSGNKKQAPKWMQRSGLEWTFRLATEPRRLWRRYLLGLPYFSILVVAQALGLRRYSVED